MLNSVKLCIFVENHAYNCLLKNELLGTEIDDLKVSVFHSICYFGT